MARKTVQERINEVKRKEAWRLIRTAEKLEARASEMRKRAAMYTAELEGK